jgi:acetylornithine deacetylase/succinyl-diaminopimelate desuccinylase-like protein
MIPDACTIRVDSRPHPGLDETEVREALQAAIDKIAAQQPDTRYEMVLADRKNSYLIEREHPLVQALDASVRDVTGEDPRYAAGSWLADTASFGELVPTVIFGPGHDPIYTPNESLAVSDIERAAEIYTVATVRLLGGGP